MRRSLSTAAALRWLPVAAAISYSNEVEGGVRCGRSSKDGGAWTGEVKRKMGRRHVGPRATVPRGLTVVIQTKIQINSNFV
jgi:hypothetical protein